MTQKRIALLIVHPHKNLPSHFNYVLSTIAREDLRSRPPQPDYLNILTFFLWQKKSTHVFYAEYTRSVGTAVKLDGMNRPRRLGTFHVHSSSLHASLRRKRVTCDAMGDEQEGGAAPSPKKDYNMPQDTKRCPMLGSAEVAKFNPTNAGRRGGEVAENGNSSGV